jgi:hypothetical protein
MPFKLYKAPYALFDLSSTRTRAIFVKKALEGSNTLFDLSGIG